MDIANATPTISISFLYQLIGQEVVEKAVLREQLLRLQNEVREIRAAMAANDPAGAGETEEAGPA